MRNARLLLFGVLLLGLVAAVSAQNLPIGLQKIIEHNQQETEEFALTVSFFIAFLAGILTIFSPCLLPLIPAYFSYTFKERTNITRMTLVFFAGFAVVFTALGVVAGFLGEQTLSVVQDGMLVMLAGFFLVFLGLLTLAGKGFSSFFRFRKFKKFKNDVTGVFLFGMSFALGWTACTGPILAGILGLGAILGNVWQSALLLFFYALGNLVPLFVLSVFYDKLNLADRIKPKRWRFALGTQVVHVHPFNVLAGVLFILIGAVLVVFKGTAIVNAWDVFGTKQFFYDFQNALLTWPYANAVGIAAFVLFTLLIVWVLWRRK